MQWKYDELMLFMLVNIQIDIFYVQMYMHDQIRTYTNQRRVENPDICVIFWERWLLNKRNITIKYEPIFDVAVHNTWNNYHDMKQTSITFLVYHSSTLRRKGVSKDFSLSTESWEIDDVMDVCCKRACARRQYMSIMFCVSKPKGIGVIYTNGYTIRENIWMNGMVCMHV